METKKYLEALKEIADFDKLNKLNLEPEIVVEILNQVGIDSRLKSMPGGVPFKEKEEPKEFIPATEGQIKALKSMKKFKEGLSKSEAWEIIHNSNKNNKKEEKY